MNKKSILDDLRQARAEINRLKMTVAKVAELVPHLQQVAVTPLSLPEVADLVRCHNAALDELLLLMIHDDQPQIIVYGHDSEPSMAVDSATLEVHDEY